MIRAIDGMQVFALVNADDQSKVAGFFCSEELASQYYTTYLEGNGINYHLTSFKMIVPLVYESVQDFNDDTTSLEIIKQGD